MELGEAAPLIQVRGKSPPITYQPLEPHPQRVGRAAAMNQVTRRPCRGDRALFSMRTCVTSGVG